MESEESTKRKKIISTTFLCYSHVIANAVTHYSGYNLMVRSMFQNNPQYDGAACNGTASDGESAHTRELFRALTLGTLTALSPFYFSAGARESYGQETHDTSLVSPHTPFPNSDSKFPFEVTLPGEASSIPELFRKFNDPSVFTITFGKVISRDTQLLPQLLLHDGTSLHAPITIEEKLSWGKSELKSSWQGKEFVASTMTVKAFRPQPNPHYSTAWELVRVREFREDTLLVRANEGMLTEISGQVIALSKDSVEFQFSGETINAPLRKIEGIIFAPVRGKSWGTGISVINDDGTFQCTDVVMREGSTARILLTTKCGATFSSSMQPFELNRLAAKNHFLWQIAHEIETWKPFEVSDDENPLTFSLVPSSPIEFDKNSEYGGVILHGALKAHLRLRNKYEKVILGVPEGPAAVGALSLYSENGPITLSYRHKEEGSVFAEADLKGARELWIEFESQQSLRLEPLIFSPQ